ncbi:MAG: UDP-N-acetylmuramoyl-L-alanine--D-glutamate ligase [Candidatus Moranbacteria bacterium]|nr:UDP-N-acetylmuramoyl-L-alanine--D-glutamate ligase [Candidatus Moranbacteria bacterium]
MTLDLRPQTFDFTSYTFEPSTPEIFFHYQITFKNSPSISFTERLVFPQPFTHTPDTLTPLLEALHLMLGISYYKLYCPKKITLPYTLSKEEASFWNTTYQKGLGEFFFRNNLDPKTVHFPHTEKKTFFTKKHPPLLPKHSTPKKRVLLGIGGGKDSIVAGEILKKNKEDVTALLIETERVSPISQRVVGVMDIPTLTIKRFLDPKIFLSHPGAYNGHIPISAIFAFIGYTAALVYDYASIIVGNEQSSNSGNTLYRGMEINHQWSKSAEFEALFQEYTRTFLSPQIRYFSLLRPFHEIRIAKMFAQSEQYFSTFSSCNRSYRIHKDPSAQLWCGECPKCVFVFLLLSPFIERSRLVRIFSRNLFENTSLIPLFEDILGLGKMKPFDCVGTFEEARVALHLAKKAYQDTPVMKLLSKQIHVSEEEEQVVFRTTHSPTVPDKYKFYGIENVMIAGYGKEGKVSQKYVQLYFPWLNITIKDGLEDPDYLNQQKQYDLIIKTPGIPKEKITGHYTTATNIFFSQVPQLKIGVTGSKGKSTTASLIFHLLKEAGHPAVLVGNIGTPMLETLLNSYPKETIFVIELSSYQLDDIVYSPEIALFLNLFPDHLNYHQTFEKYRKAKENIYRYQNKNDILFYNLSNTYLKKKNDFPKNSFSFVDTDLPVSKTPLIGRHNEDNLRAAVAIAHLFKIDTETLCQAIESFQPLPHRLQYIGTYQNILFYDDAISTTPESTIEGLLALPHVDTIFLGGEDRGYDFSALEKTLRQKKVKNLVLFPDTGTRILKKRTGFNIFETTSMEEAVRFAFSSTKKNSICLLSTASPSYTLWKNFEEKGDSFQSWIRQIDQENNNS